MVVTPTAVFSASSCALQRMRARAALIWALPIFCAVLGDGQRWIVEVDWPDGTIEQVGEFQHRSEATDWISNQSEAWLQERG